MFGDTSALIAILAGEPDAAALVARLQHARQRLTSPYAVFETTIALSRILDLPLPEAREAFERYGRGHHPAGLTHADCFAYACAQAYRMPLLFKGNRFPLMDIVAGRTSYSRS
jgi:ribonuclease VapC